MSLWLIRAGANGGYEPQFFNDTLDEDLRSELPLKRIWTITNQGEE